MKRARAPVSTKSHDRSVETSTTFSDCRASLASTIESLAFVRVVCTQNSSAGYTGEAIEILFRESREKPKLIFFDKFGRNRSQLTLGPIHLVQAPMGFDHASAQPTVGEILVGSLVPNTRKSHLEFVLRGWSSDAKPLQELLRLLKFGTRYHELEVRSALVQSGCLLLQCPEELRKSRDDIYMTARIILWGNLRPLQILATLQNEDYTLKKPASNEEIEMAKNIKISVSAIEFIDGMIVKWPDVNLSEKFLEALDHRPKPAWHAKAIEPAWKSEFKPFETNFVPSDPRSYASEAYVPKSPPYAPHSPYAPTSPAYAPKSPAYAPRSPPYVPESPKGSETPKLTAKIANKSSLSKLVGSQSPIYDDLTL